MEKDLKNLYEELMIIYCSPFALRVIEGRGQCALMRQIYTVGLVYGLDQDENYEGRYCYHSLAEARDALREWEDGSVDPPGNWIKHKGGAAGEYRNPNYEQQ